MQPRLIALICVLSIGGILWAVGGVLHPAKPTNPFFHPQIEAQSSVEFWENRARNEPRGALTNAILAEAYQARYRTLGDITDVARAEKSARASLSIRPNTRAYMALTATLLTHHKFDEGIAITKIVGDTPQSLYQRGEAYLEKNDLPHATQYIGQGRALSAQKGGDDPFGKALQARLFEKEGDPKAAQRLYQEAAQQADTTHGLSANTVCWFYTRLAACQLHQNDLFSARQSLQKALKICPTDWRAQGLAKKLP